MTSLQLAGQIDHETEVASAPGESGGCRLLGNGRGCGLSAPGDIETRQYPGHAPDKARRRNRPGGNDHFAEGVVQLPGAAAVLKRVGRVTRDDLVAADGIILGCPTYYANIPGRMKTAWKMKVDFTDKAGGAFATGGGQMGGKEHVVISLLLFMINNRMIVAGPLYTDEEGDDIWAETGAGAMTGPIDPGIGKNELDSARRLGERVAQLAIRLKGQPAATGGIRPTRQPWK